MWQQVFPGDTELVQTAYEVLKVHDASFESVDQFRNWLQDRLVYYGTTRNVELVIGFRFRQAEGEWRVATAGLRGALSDAVIDEVVPFVVEFMRKNRTRALYALAWKRASSDPIELMFKSLAAAARNNPHVLEIAAVDAGAEQRWGIVLK